MHLILASSSARRKFLLRMLVDCFESVAPAIDEVPEVGEAPSAYTMRLAKAKAKKCWGTDSVALGGDTIVVLDQEIMAKPMDITHAKEYLVRLSGRIHEVHTSIAVWNGAYFLTDHISSEVKFIKLTNRMIDQCIDRDDSLNKAGGYAIQGFAGSFVQSIRGSYSAIVGLPLCETRELLIKAGVIPYD